MPSWPAFLSPLGICAWVPTVRKSTPVPHCYCMCCQKHTPLLLALRYRSLCPLVLTVEFLSLPNFCTVLLVPPWFFDYSRIPPFFPVPSVSFVAFPGIGSKAFRSSGKHSTVWLHFPSPSSTVNLTGSVTESNIATWTYLLS